METITKENDNVLSVKEWALTIFITSLPLIGLIMLLVWAFSDDTNIHKKNWSKGNLLIMIVIFILIFSFLFLFGGIALIATAFN